MDEFQTIAQRSHIRPMSIPDKAVLKGRRDLKDKSCFSEYGQLVATSAVVWVHPHAPIFVKAPQMLSATRDIIARGASAMISHEIDGRFISKLPNHHYHPSRALLFRAASVAVCRWRVAIQLAHRILSRMQACGLTPNQVSYGICMDACSKAGLWEKVSRTTNMLLLLLPRMFCFCHPRWSGGVPLMVLHFF